MKIIKTWSKIVQTVLMAPIKLPGKALSIIKYIALGLGIIETMIDDKEEQNADRQLSKPPDQDAESRLAEQTLGSAFEKDKVRSLSSDHADVDKMKTSENQLSDTLKLDQGIIEYEWEPESYVVGNGENNETKPQDSFEKGKEVPDEGQ